MLCTTRVQIGNLLTFLLIFRCAAVGTEGTPTTTSTKIEAGPVEIECGYFQDEEAQPCTCPEGWTFIGYENDDWISDDNDEKLNCTNGERIYCCDIRPIELLDHLQEPAGQGDSVTDVNGTSTGDSSDREYTNAGRKLKKQNVAIYGKDKYSSVQDAAKGAVTKEARIILPIATNDGRPLTQVRAKLEIRLIKNFGGFTRFDSFGGWMEGERLFTEPGWVYDVAVAVNGDSERKLVKIANWLKIEAEQESIYLRQPEGMILFI